MLQGRHRVWNAWSKPYVNLEIKKYMKLNLKAVLSDNSINDVVTYNGD